MQQTDSREAAPGDIDCSRCSRTPSCVAPSGDIPSSIMPPSWTSSADGRPDFNPSSGNPGAPPASMPLQVISLIRSKSLATGGFVESPPAVMRSAEALVRGSSTEM